MVFFTAAILLLAGLAEGGFYASHAMGTVTLEDDGAVSACLEQKQGAALQEILAAEDESGYRAYLCRFQGTDALAFFLFRQDRVMEARYRFLGKAAVEPGKIAFLGQSEEDHTLLALAGENPRGEAASCRFWAGERLGNREEALRSGAVLRLYLAPEKVTASTLHFFDSDGTEIGKGAAQRSAAVGQSMG